jgi:transitional endoplasmic reticulum ATPase
VSVSYDAFERMKNKGVAAYKRGDFPSAQTYLIEAAESMLQIAEQSKETQVARRQEEYAAEMIALAKECGLRDQTKRPQRRREADTDQEEKPGAEEWLVRDRPDICFSDIAGLDDVKQEIQVKMIYPFMHPELAGKFGIGRGGGVLLIGPPGTGKTMIAKAICGEIDAAFYVISPAQMLSKWVGEAEQNVANLFEAAKAEPKSVIFIDELEALAPKRRGSSSTVMQRVVPQILQELEGFDRKDDRALLFIGATNEPWSIDPAMMRPGRLDSKIYVPLPDAPARYKMLEMFLTPRPLDPEVDFGRLCDLLEGYSGADIKNICDRAATAPFLEAAKGGQERAISMNDILDVIEKTSPSVSSTEAARYEQFLAAE